MGAGDKTWEGGAVPLLGESTIIQQVNGTDILTVNSVADATAANMVKVAITSTSALTAGYLQGFYVNMNLDGGATGGVAIQQNAFAADITIDSTFSTFASGMYVYVAEGSSGSTPAAGSLAGYVSFFESFGAAFSYRAGFRAYSAEPTASTATAIDAAFLSESAGSTGTWGALIGGMGITPPKYFLHYKEAPGTARMVTDAITGASGSSAGLRVLLASTYYSIALYASTSGS